MGRRSIGVGFLCALSVGCGSAGTGADDPELEPITAWSAPDDGDPTTPEVVLTGANASVRAFREGHTGLMEVQLRTNDGDIAVRSFFDPATNGLLAAYDEVTGHTLLVLQDDADNPSQYYFLTYDAEGYYVDGHAARVVGEDLRVAHLLGRPTFQGQLFAQLSGDGQTGSFAVTASNDSNVVTPEGPLVAEGEVSVPRSALVFAQALDQLDGRPSVDASGLLPRTLKVAGALGVAVAAAGGAPVWAAVGVAAVVASAVSNDVATSVESRFKSEDPTAQACVDLVVDVLRDPNGSGLVERLDRGMKRAEAIYDGIRDGVDSLTGVFEDGEAGSGASSAWSDVASWTEDVLDSARTDLSGLLEVVYDTFGETDADVGLEGVAVFQDGATFDLDGLIDDGGDVTLDGDAADGRALHIEGRVTDGKFKGTFDLDDGENGTASGEAGALGDCESAVGSGGSGTFTFAHYVGVGPGSLRFWYDAHGVPDAFTVIGPGGTLFSTGGLVSGDKAYALSIAEDGPATVIVSVSAPESGTVWDYTLGCLGG